MKFLLHQKDIWPTSVLLYEKMKNKEDNFVQKQELMNAICDNDVFSHFACLSSNDECFVSSLHHILQLPTQFSWIFFNFTIVVIVWNLQQKPKNIVF